jgi:Tol biopolymer transport system component
MDQSHVLDQPCRLVPFDGSSMGRQVGPEGGCTAADWSPDGKWMYFAGKVGAGSHLWRQRFPDGEPEQLTFGPLEEEGVSVARDGRSLVTSLGMRRSAIWIRDTGGERSLTSEGYARLPQFSRDGARIFYLRQQNASSLSGELRVIDLRTGKTNAVLPGMSVTDYDISRDEKEVVFTAREVGKESRIWLAPLDGRSSPRPLVEGDQVSFGTEGDLFFRARESNMNSLVRINKDGTGRQRLLSESIVYKYGVSPDGRWVIVFTPATGDHAEAVTLAVPVGGGVPRKVCSPSCPTTWSFDGRLLYVSRGNTVTSPARTLAIPIPAGQMLPDLPPSGIGSIAGGLKLPGAVLIEHDSVSPGPDSSSYLFTRMDLQRNLYRIPLN